MAAGEFERAGGVVAGVGSVTTRDERLCPAELGPRLPHTQAVLAVKVACEREVRVGLLGPAQRRVEQRQGQARVSEVQRRQPTTVVSGRHDWNKPGGSGVLVRMATDSGALSWKPRV